MTSTHGTLHGSRLTRLALACVTALTAIGCQSDLSNVEALSGRASRQAAIRTQTASQLELRFGGIVRDDRAQAAIDRIGRQLLDAADDCRINCYFRLLESSRVNAFSVPEGGVYVTSGLYRRLNSEDLLAAALAHEIAHVAAGDGWKTARSRTARLEKEIRADRRAIRYLRAAGFQATAMSELLELMNENQPPGWGAARKQALDDLREDEGDSPRAQAIRR